MAEIVALQRTDRFVGRTMNWLYDHLRAVRRHRCAVLCDQLQNRGEFPELQARALKPNRLSRRIWRRIAGPRLFPTDSRWVRRLAPGIFHSHFGYVAAADVDLAKAVGVPWVVSFYGADVYQLPRHAEWRRRYRSVFDRACRVLALGPAMAERLVEVGCPTTKVVVHALGVEVNDLPVEVRVLRSGEPLRLLFAGSFREKKGIPYIMEAVARVHRIPIRVELHLVGDATAKPGDRETKDAVLERIRELGLENVVIQYPMMRFAELIALARRCHLFLAPSVTSSDGDAEGTPFVLQQMMATGMSCIATLHSDVPYIFGPHRAMLVPERDSSAIAERLVAYARNPGMLIEHGQLLGEQIRRDFDVRVCADRLSSVYDEAVDAAGSA